MMVPIYSSISLVTTFLLTTTINDAMAARRISAMDVYSYSSGELEESCGHKAFLGDCEDDSEYMWENCKEECEEWTEEMDNHNLENFNSFYDLSAKDIDGNLVSFEQFREKNVVIVNVASHSNKTDQHYEELVELYNDFIAKDRQAEILAFPCNQFGEGEPDGPAEIKKFAQSKGVQFRMMEKIHVNGKNSHTVYKWMKTLTGPYKIESNFGTYFIIDEGGDVEGHSDTTPLELEKELLFYWDDKPDEDEL